MVIHDSSFFQFFESGVFLIFMGLTVISLSSPFWSDIRKAFKSKK
jgi:putative tricarboxylic transport membrane protein